MGIMSGGIALSVLFHIKHKNCRKNGILCVSVADYGKADFKNLQEALDFISADNNCRRAYIYLSAGLYSGQFYFNGYRDGSDSSGIILGIKGCGPDKTVISGCLCATMPFPVQNGDIEKRGTFRSYTAFFSGPEVSLSDMTIENTAGLEPPSGCGRNAEQAVALYADASVMRCRNVRFLGFQDTLFASPLPAAEHIPGGFNGPRVYSPRIPSVQVYTHCHIEGTIDFIYGGAGALFDHCSIFVRKQNGCGTCYIAAPSADVPAYIQPDSGIPEVRKSGFVFYRCRIEGDSDSPVFLARPWRSYARCAYIRCRLGNIIHPAGWDNWNDRENEKKCFFAEFRNYGPGAVGKTGNKRAFGTQLTRQKASDLVRQFDPYR